MKYEVSVADNEISNIYSSFLSLRKIVHELRISLKGFHMEQTGGHELRILGT